jgi:hypothetical protein
VWGSGDRNIALHLLSFSELDGSKKPVVVSGRFFFRKKEVHALKTGDVV